MGKGVTLKEWRQDGERRDLEWDGIIAYMGKDAEEEFIKVNVLDGDLNVIRFYFSFQFYKTKNPNHLLIRV